MVFYYTTDSGSSLFTIFILFFGLIMVFGTLLPYILGRGGNRQPQRGRQAPQPAAARRGKDVVAEFEKKLQAGARKPEAGASRVYSEPEPQAAPLQAQSQARPAGVLVEHRPVRHFAHPALAQGFVMAEILGRPLCMRRHDGQLPL